MLKGLKEHLRQRKPAPGAWSALRFLGPGLLVTVGFIDPGNWASNVAAGAAHGTALLWVVTLGTLMLILLQHNAAHLGIATGLCLSEGATRYLPAWLSRTTLASAMLAGIATAFAEILGGAIALQMLFHIPLKLGATLVTLVVGVLLVGNTYRLIEKLIVGFVSLIGLAFLFELGKVQVPWGDALRGWVTPVVPHGAGTLILSLLGAVVMPHNLFLHSEFIQSRQWHDQDAATRDTHLKFEFLDTLLSMGVGWAINSAMILLAAASFFQHRIPVDSLEQAEAMLRPLIGPSAATVFALALLAAGLASTLTAGMAGGSIFAGIFDRPYDIKARTGRAGVALTLLPALAGVLVVSDTLKALVWSQVVLSLQLPITITLLVGLTSSRRVMGSHANRPSTRVILWAVAAVVTGLNIWLLISQ